jgi:hypothetical protein
MMPENGSSGHFLMAVLQRGFDMESITSASVSISDFGEDENGILHVSSVASSWRGVLPEAIGSAIARAVLKADERVTKPTDRGGLLTLAFAVRAFHANQESRKRFTEDECKLLRAAELLIQESTAVSVEAEPLEF